MDTDARLPMRITEDRIARLERRVAQLENDYDKSVGELVAERAVTLAAQLQAEMCDDSD